MGGRRGAGRRDPPARAGDPRRRFLPLRLRRPHPRLRRHRRGQGAHRRRSPPPWRRCSRRPAAAGLGLFTAIRRLRESYHRMAPGLEAAGIPLYAQHVDAMDNATLVDVFRAEENACLLGTDAMRDGVDVPGRSLRLLVFDRVPWPRPSILHRERRIHLSGGEPKAYDDAAGPAPAAPGLRPADPPGRRPRASSCCSTAPARRRLLAGLPEGVEVAPAGAGGGGGGNAALPRLPPCTPRYRELTPPPRRATGSPESEAACCIHPSSSRRKRWSAPWC